MQEAQNRGWELIYLEMNDLFLRDGQAEGRMRKVSVKDDYHNWFTIERDYRANLSELDAIIMRKDPPFDIEYIMATYILERAEEAGVIVLNKANRCGMSTRRFSPLGFLNAAPLAF
ncbi:hypothetical protein [Algoriphagus boritolerans]|uniref:hypothetical protein n=1 Tax=Algoriphagus boritolerans TaxID=308111 RepID=UPI000AE69E0C